MVQLGDVVDKVRSKNAGPFWITVDVFCGSQEAYDVARAVPAQRIADLFGVDVGTLKRFEIDDLLVLKISFPRPVIQGSRFDRDMHGAQAAHLLNELLLDEAILSGQPA